MYKINSGTLVIRFEFELTLFSGHHPGLSHLVVIGAASAKHEEHEGSDLNMLQT